MRGTTLGMAAIAAAALALTGCRDRTGTETAQPAAPGAAATVVGTVTEVDAGHLNIETQDQGEIEFDLRDPLDFERGRIDAQMLMERLDEGMQVRATYQAAGDEKRLTAIEVIGGAAAGPQRGGGITESQGGGTSPQQGGGTGEPQGGGTSPQQGGTAPRQQGGGQ